MVVLLLTTRPTHVSSRCVLRGLGESGLVLVVGVTVLTVMVNPMHIMRIHTIRLPPVVCGVSSRLHLCTGLVQWP